MRGSRGSRGRSGTRRGSAKTKDEHLTTFYGITDAGELVSIIVYRKGGSIILSGPHGTHPVHTMNASNVAGWRRETILVWHLSHVTEAHSRELREEHERKLAKLRKLVRAARLLARAGR